MNASGMTNRAQGSGVCRVSAAFALCMATVLQVGCASAPVEETNQMSITPEDCEQVEALLLDPAFATIPEAGNVWSYRQHAGDQSFSVQVIDGQLDFERIADEPWAIIVQTITDPRLSGRTVRYSAALKGDVSEDVSHAFGAKAGLWLRLGPRPDANMADHEPNVGQWDWQRVSVEAKVPEVFDSVEVGLLYQGGEGVMSARLPKFELADCTS